MQFSKEQLAAVTAPIGPVLVTAGPGSGKTQVLTGRLRYMIEEGIAPSSILVLTFSRKAASEMQQRFEAQYGKYPQMVFGTLHAICFRILSEEKGYRSQDLITDASLKYRYIRQVTQQLGITYDAVGERDAVQRLASAIDYVRNTHNYDHIPCRRELFDQILDAYEKHLTQLRQIDFDGILSQTCRILEDDAVCRKWQNRWKHVVVDEFQDLNPVQYDMIGSLFSHTSSIYVLGDDDQSIYGFRGAMPDLMQKFLRDYTGSVSYKLQTNYRSKREIVKYCNLLIAENRNRLSKKMEPYTKESGKVRLHSLKDQEKESKRMLDLIQEAHDQGIALSEIAVLSRSFYSLSCFRTHLYQHGIPYQMHGQKTSLLHHDITQDLLAYLRLSKQKAGAADLVRILNRPPRNLSRGGMDYTSFSFKKWCAYAVRHDCGKEEALRLTKDLASISTLSCSSAVLYILYTMGYESWVLEDAIRKGRESETRMILDQIKDSLCFFETEEWISYLQQEEVLASRDKGVILSSIHASKGLEYEWVLIPDINEGLLPHAKAHTPEEIEEERRLLYVAMSRAKSQLHLLSVDSFRLHPVEASRFLNAFAKE